MTRRAAACVTAAALVLGLAACVPEPQDGEARRDPAPSFADARTTQVDERGDRWSAAHVSIDVPRDAVRANAANITVGDPLGEADSGIARELFGTPVRIETPTVLSQPASLSWDVSDLSSAAASAATAVRWDRDLRVWRPSPDPVSVEDGRLTVAATEPGIVSWAAPVLQTIADAEDQDAAAPSCTDAALPSWAGAFADPDAARPESAIAACREAHRDDVLTVRTVNRDDTARVLTLDGDEAFDWVTRDSSLTAFWQTAAGLVDDDGTVLLPPGAEVATGIDEAGRASARIDTRTAALDLLSAFSAHVSFGEVSDRHVSALVETLSGCVAGPAPLADAASVTALGLTLTACAQDLTDPDSDASGTLSENAGAGEESAADTQGERAVAAAIRVAAAGAFDEIAAARSEALIAASASPLGGASWAVLPSGGGGDLGSWTPTCTDAESDASALYAVLAGRPEAAEASSLADLPGWRTDAADAVAPLASCSPDERARFAAQLPDLWPDPDAALAPVEALAGLGLALLSCEDLFTLTAPVSGGFHTLRGISASGTGRVACGWSAEEGRSIDDADLPSYVQVWVSHENADADEVTRRRTEASAGELGLQESDVLDAAGGFVVGAYVPTGLELESWLPGYRIAVTTTSGDDPAQWRMSEAIAAVEAIATALTDD
ncbi:hypothetical protein [Microbacterium marinilacus]|uniref:Uncharacterized protein n=2 Tax=Microbacterium marinilacus TaxID=415209 RepID=A0ABP7BAU0_9MICO|nr:hypothetical protein [Microbacterium marinilacus]